MSEESTTPDLVQRAREFYGLWIAGTLTRLRASTLVMSFGKTMVAGGSFEGFAAMRGFLEDWLGSFDEWQLEAEEVLDLGNGVTFAVLIQEGKPVGSDGYARQRFASVLTWVGGVVAGIKDYTDPDEGRAAAERLAGERG